MTTLPTSPRRPRNAGSTDPSRWDRSKKDAYINAFAGAVRSTLAKSKSLEMRADAAEVAGFGVERLLTHRTVDKMRAYPDPVRYGRSAAVNLWRDWNRRNAADRGEGALGGVIVTSYDELLEEDGAPSFGTDPADVAADRADAAAIVARVRVGVSERDWEIFILVTVEGWTTVEVARRFNLRRETVSRIISATRATMLAALV